MSRTPFDTAKHDLLYAIERNTRLCDPFVSAIEITGAAVSVLSQPIGSSTVSASDATAARIDELQFDLGEGPCWDAMSSRLPVLRPTLREDARGEWPAFGEALATDEHGDRVASVFAFPLVVGSLEIGAVDLYSSTSMSLDTGQVSDASALATLAAWQVLRKITSDVTEELPRSSRRGVHQATGMVIAQLEISADDAYLLLRAHAYSSGQTLQDFALAIVERRIDLSPGARPSGPEVG